jgi:hypothetical protein
MMGKRTWGFTTSLGAVVITLALAGPSFAGMLDLTTQDASGFINGAFFQQINPQSTGTGVIDSFVRLQANGTEQGYNTDARPVQFDEKTDATFTHSLLLSDVPKVTINGTVYRQFLLDINEGNGQNQQLLSLDQLKIFQGATGDLNNYPNLGDQVYDLGAGNFIGLDYSLNSGSGAGDMFAYIPDSFFTSANPYVYLYSHFGSEWGSDGTSDAGFEEWAVLKQDTTPPVNDIPGPATLVFAALGCGLGLVGYATGGARGTKQ